MAVKRTGDWTAPGARFGAFIGQARGEGNVPLAPWPLGLTIISSKKDCVTGLGFIIDACPLTIQDRVSLEFLIEINLEGVSSISAMLCPSTHHLHSTLHSILSAAKAPLIQNVTHNGLKSYLDSV